MKYQTVEIEGTTVTLRSKEGYPLAQTVYKTVEEAEKVFNLKIKEMVKR